MIFLVPAICWTGFWMWMLCYWAPHVPTPNRCRRFILIAPLHHDDPWGEKRDAEPDHWWMSAIEYAYYLVVLCCMIWPLLGFIVLLLITMRMAYRFIQKITETGPYAQPEEGGE